MSAIDTLYTPVDPPSYGDKINYKDFITLAGSCFAEHISEKLLRYKYNVVSNPFGILFNPISIARCFERIVNQEFYHDDELIQHDGLYHSMDHHGSYSGRDKALVLRTINETIEKTHLHLSKCKFVFVSLGSAKVYRYKATGKIAGNCHKIPQSSFDTFRLPLSECELALEKIAQLLRKIAPGVHIIWTVSPVRHLRDGIEENQLSKSTLLLAIDHQRKVQPNSGYFPAYEIMMDQLRDYRYYARDLTHPSSLAIDIIWDIFTTTYLNPREKDVHAMIEKVHLAREHRFIHDDKAQIRSFAEKQLKNIEQLEGLFPDMNLKEERQYFFQLTEPD